MMIFAVWGIVLVTAATQNYAQAQPREQSIAVSAQVDAGNWQGIRLQNLPKGAQLEIRLLVEHDLRAIIVDDSQFGRLPHIDWPLAAMSGKGYLDFTVIVPESGTYYLILDNREGTTSNRVAVSVTAFIR